MAFIKALSYYLPARVVTNAELLQDFPEWNGEKVAAKVGIRSRHIAGEEETVGDMAEKAAKKLFEDYHISPACIDFVILCTQSPDYKLPSTACILQHRLGIPTAAGAFDYNLGCSGFVYGLAMAKGLVTAGIARNVLLLTAETYNKYLHNADKSNRTIFGDGAAACLVSTEGFAEVLQFSLGTDGSGAEDLILRSGGSRLPQPTGQSALDDVGHLRHDDYLYMNGGAIFTFSLTKVPSLLNEVARNNDITLGEIDYFVFHQANKFMLTTLRKACKIPAEKFCIDLEDVGNTVSATIPIALCRLLEKGTITPGMRVAIAGFGVGLSWGGTMLRFR